MGRRRVVITCDFLTNLITEGHEIGYDSYIKVIEGVPEDAKLIRAWVNQGVYPDGEFNILYEHESWEEVYDGANYPTFTPKFESFYLPRS